MALEIKHPKGRELVGGDLLAQCLYALGVRVAFGLHGGHLDSFLMGCVDVGIELVDTRHETVAIQAAEGYAKVSGKTGCCFATANSGFSNALPGLATALADNSPLFCVTSSAPLRDALTNALQDYHDQVVISRPLTKFSHRVTNVEEIPRLVSLAWRAATSGAPGPVLVDFPIDVLFTPVDLERVSWGSIAGPIPHLPGPDPGAVEEVIGLLRGSERPAIIVGTGAQAAVPALTAFLDKTPIPTFYSPKFSTTLPRTHPSYAGPATSLAILHLQNQPPPDLVILLGARTGFILGGRSNVIVPAPSSGSKVIQVSTDSGEIGRSSHISLGIVSDVSLFLTALSASLARTSAYAAPESWTRTALSLQTIRSPQNEGEAVICAQTGHLHPYHAIRSVFSALPEKTILCLDGGECSGWALQLLPQAANISLSLLATGYMGFLGNGWGYTLGAAVASSTTSTPSSANEKKDVQWVVNLQGDGSAGFHVSTLDTYAKFGLRVITLVVNNACWGMSLAGQDLLYKNDTTHRPISSLRPETRYDVIAQGFGCKGILVDVTKNSDGGDAKLSDQEALDRVKQAIREVVERDQGPALIDLRISRFPVHGTTKSMVGDVEAKDQIVVPYYDNLPRPWYKK